MTKIIQDEEIAKFFDTVLKTDLKDEFKRPLVDSKYKLKSNIIYLTSDCSIICDYCYQLKDRSKLQEQTYQTKENSNNFFEDLLKREPHGDSTVVIFGGEPFLNDEIVYYIFDLTNMITQINGKKFNLSLTTNGIYFKNDKNFKKFIEKSKALENHFSLEISYDGVGHDRRKYKNGKSTKSDVEEVLKKFKNINYDITIRYTIHKDNFKDCLRDLVKLSLEYKKIVVNFNETELEKFCNVNDLKEKLKRQTCEIFKRTKTSICHLNCQACLGCNFEQFDGIYYQYNDKNFEVNGNAKIFNSFTEGN